ncbi:MAG: RNA 3'-terminal phosphate cyclase [Alphaproteobacteria bacterium]|nr:RNA 3'-terminal phosphate cyclase [Alphaproteobacteria bacterium]
MAELLAIDGAYGEGGGQIVRTAVALAALTGRGIRIDNVRAKRPNPGLAAQHLTAVRAAAQVCEGHLVGDSLGSRSLTFFPRTRPKPGNYFFDVGAARPGGSAGAATLVLAAVLLPLAFAAGPSTVRIKGGTHMPWSPPYDYANDVWLPALAGMGVAATLALKAWGWFPHGEGAIDATIAGQTTLALKPLVLTERGAFRRVFGRAAAANLPPHVAQRMTDRAKAGLRRLSPRAAIVPENVRAASPGAGLFLTLEYEHTRAGFSALGEAGTPSETVADAAVQALLAHHEGGAPVDRYLADQLLPALALAKGPSAFATAAASGHLRANAWVIERFGLAQVAIAEAAGCVRVTVTPAAA